MNSIEGKANGKRSHGRSVAMELGITALAVVLLAFIAATQFETGTGTVSLIAYMVPFSPSPVMVNDSASSTLTAEIGSDYNPPVPSGDENEGALTYMYDWSVSQVQYKALAADQFGSPPSNSYTDSISPSQPSTGSSADLEFTPKIAGYWSVSTSCTVTVTDTKNNEKWSGSANCGPENLTSYTLDITYSGPVVGQTNPDSGTVVTNGQINVHAGWPIQLGAALAPSDLTSQFTWSIDGAGPNGSAAINGFIVGENDNSGTVYPLVPANDTTNAFPSQTPLVLNPILFHYYYTEGGRPTASVQPQGINGVSAKTTFIVTVPAITVSTVKGVVAFDSNDPGLLQPAMHDGIPETGLDGIKFTATKVPDGFSGGVKWGQIYSEDDSFTDAAGNQFHRRDTGLDTVWPYGADANLGDGEYGTDDSPAVSSQIEPNLINMSINDNPTMYLMYAPGTAGSIWVPIQYMPWSWSGSASVVNGQWQASGLNNTGPQGKATNSYPVWTHLAAGSPQPGP